MVKGHGHSSNIFFSLFGICKLERGEVSVSCKHFRFNSCESMYHRDIMLIQILALRTLVKNKLTIATESTKNAIRRAATNTNIECSTCISRPLLLLFVNSILLVILSAFGTMMMADWLLCCVRSGKRPVLNNRRDAVGWRRRGTC